MCRVAKKRRDKMLEQAKPCVLKASVAPSSLTRRCVQRQGLEFNLGSVQVRDVIRSWRIIQGICGPKLSNGANG